MSARSSGILMLRFLGLWSTKSAIENELDESKSKARDNEPLTAKSLIVEPHCQYSNDSNAVKQSSRKIVELMLETGAPGLTVCVAKRGHIVWKTAFGFCDVENQLTCDPDAQMRIASISKPLFATTIVAPMIEQNKIDLKASVHNYLTKDEFPKQKYQDKEHDITVEQLLSHTSGIKHYIEYQPEVFTLKPIGSEGSKKIYQAADQFNRDDFYQRKTFRNVIEALDPFKAGPLAGEPGKYLYTTYGYTLLSAVAQKVHQSQGDDGSKQATEQIEDFWIKILRRDWGMKNTLLDQDEPIIPRRARYYLRTGFNGGLINAPYTDTSVKWAGGGINSNTEDLIKFSNALIDCYKERAGAKLKRSTVELLWKKISDKYALGFSVRQSRPDKPEEKLAIYHGGGALGASSFLLIIPESEIVVVLLTNLGCVNLSEVAFHIAKQFDE